MARNCSGESSWVYGCGGARGGKVISSFRCISGLHDHGDVQPSVLAREWRGTTATSLQRRDATLGMLACNEVASVDARLD